MNTGNTEKEPNVKPPRIEGGQAQPAPVVKWAGGKRQLMDVLLPMMPKNFSLYCEPFLGGGAALFRLLPQRARVNDINQELIGLYEVIRDDLTGLLDALRGFTNDPECYYAVRAWDRDRDRYEALSPAQRAARVLYLNKTCYNGLYRVNKAGQFNTPFGRYRNPNIINEPLLRAVSQYLKKADVRFFCTDYAEVLRDLPVGAFVYLDPPYDPVSPTANFTSYACTSFGRQEQIRLRQCCDELDKRGIRFMLSNTSTDFIRRQYAAYRITTVQAGRCINADASRRGKIEEVVVRNYE